MSIRVVHNADFEAIADITNHYITTSAIHFGYEPVTADDMRAMRKDRYPFLVDERDGRIVAFALAADAFDEDCRRAVVVASAIDAPGNCKARVIDRRALRREGATALYVDGDGFLTEVARPPTMDRPWARAAADARERQPSIRRPAAPDATPAADAIEAGD